MILAATELACVAARMPMPRERRGRLHASVLLDLRGGDIPVFVESAKGENSTRSLR
jgi:hypothetical protein